MAQAGASPRRPPLLDLAPPTWFSVRSGAPSASSSSPSTSANRAASRDHSRCVSTSSISGEVSAGIPASSSPPVQRGAADPGVRGGSGPEVGLAVWRSRRWRPRGDGRSHLPRRRVGRSETKPAASPRLQARNESGSKRTAPPIFKCGIRPAATPWETHDLDIPRWRAASSTFQRASGDCAWPVWRDASGRSRGVLPAGAASQARAISSRTAARSSARRAPTRLWMAATSGS